jgi:hypothetical protein
MGYVRITILLSKGGTRSGVRAFPEPMNLEDIRRHAWKLTAEALGQRAIAEIIVDEVPADDPAVVALILSQNRKNLPVSSNTGQHPYVKQQNRRPPR